ncbi:MAG: hypothetical protein N2589_02245, partial [bacterium]|nr:hypothetical protein [bacterium]
MKRLKISVIFTSLLFSYPIFSSMAIIESFEYKNLSEVQKNWFPQGKSKPVELKKENGKNITKFILNFSQVDDRCYWDKNILLDLSSFEKFIIETKSETPSIPINCTIYFESPGGWFSCWFSIDKDTWQKIIVPKAKFKIEGNPSGWDNIKKIRLSFWKTGIVDVKEGSVYFKSLKGLIPNSKIGIVFCDTAIKNEKVRSDVINRYYSDIASIFDKFEIDYKTINQSEIEKKEIESKFKILIFPYNPLITEEETEKIKRFVEKGGKIFVFYSASSEIYKILGIENAIYKKESYPGEFDTVEFDTKIIDGLPLKMKQLSWNIMCPEKINDNSKIAGYWINSEGKLTEIPACIISENGFYFSHVLLNKEDGEKLLISLILHFLPEEREKIFDLIIKNTGKLSDFENIEEVKKFIQQKMANLSSQKRKEINHFLSQAMGNYRKFKINYKKFSIREFFNQKNEIEENLKHAYFRTFKGKEKEFRAVWCHYPFGIKGFSWEEIIKKLKENNFNAIFPNMLRAGIAYYNSEILPISEEIKIKGDQILECLSACKKYGIECHIWKVNWNLSYAPFEFIEKLRKENRLQKDKFGKEVLWLCPS